MNDDRRTELVLLVVLLGAALVLLVGCSRPPEVATLTAAPEVLPVTKVVDGDTLHVTMPDGSDETVRFIGVDTPETTKGKDECAGDDATQFVRDLTGQGVVLAVDPTQADRDRYGRLIRYVQAPDGQDLSLSLIIEGLGKEVQYAAKYERQQRYVEAERAARAEGRGGWAGVGVGGCGW